ncbi:hypothetical protein QAD02_018888 [Eretmocerus hayati]|uniref:Uncharacterized protein n=1 Tax=Eretmocerus hayati TaxID=131215 RepID=A0ACC2PJT1_9HYME|nr:hypothetical protein QAD02_018888 [Eretmocerus hayati]
MTISSELREIKDTLQKIIREIAKIRQTQEQMRDEVYDVKCDLKSFKELWKKEKLEIEKRLRRLEEDKVKKELNQRMVVLEKMEETLETKQKRSHNNIKEWETIKYDHLKEIDMQTLTKSLDGFEREQREELSSSEYKKFHASEKNMILKDLQKMMKHFFGAPRIESIKIERFIE